MTVEVKSPSDKLEEVRAKIQEFIAVGTRVGILINPDDRIVEVYYSEQEALILRNQDVLTVPDLLPGWEVQISDLWAPVFD